MLSHKQSNTHPTVGNQSSLLLVKTRVGIGLIAGPQTLEVDLDPWACFQAPHYHVGKQRKHTWFITLAPINSLCTYDWWDSKLLEICWKSCWPCSLLAPISVLFLHIAMIHASGHMYFSFQCYLFNPPFPSWPGDTPGWCCQLLLPCPVTYTIRGSKVVDIYLACFSHITDRRQDQTKIHSNYSYHRFPDCAIAQFQGSFRLFV